VVDSADTVPTGDPVEALYQIDERQLLSIDRAGTPSLNSMSSSTASSGASCTLAVISNAESGGRASGSSSGPAEIDRPQRLSSMLNWNESSLSWTSPCRRRYSSSVSRE